MANRNNNLFESTISVSLQRLLLAKKEDEYINFNDVCRACLSSKNEMTEIKNVTFGELTAQEVFEKYISITIEDQDELPHQLCNLCLYELCRVYLFINNCREADTKLKEVATKYEIIEQEIYHTSANTDENGFGQDTLDKSPEDLMNMGPLRVQEPGPPFVCNNCKEVFDTLEQIKIHRRQNKHYRIRQYLCRICNPSKVYSFFHWKTHMITHTGQKPYSCNTCGKKFSTHANRARHMMIHTGVKPFSCDICLKSFIQKTQLQNHTLKVHTKDKTPGHFECGDCGKVLTSKCALRYHQVTHAEKKFLCTECGKSFHYQLQFNIHMDSHRGIRRFKCPTCDKAFTRSLSLALHKRTHTGYKPYQCKYCDKRFAQKGHLVCHNRIHTGERPYSCPYCDKTFALNGNLTVHIRKHTGEYPYVCDVCNRGFADSSSLNKHKKKHVELNVKEEMPTVVEDYQMVYDEGQSGNPTVYITPGTMKFCKICGCAETEVQKLFCFPRNNELLETWKRILGIKSEVSRAKWKICNNHFSKDSFKICPGPLKLKAGSIPMEYNVLRSIS